MAGPSFADELKLASVATVYCCPLASGKLCGSEDKYAGENRGEETVPPGGRVVLKTSQQEHLRQSVESPVSVCDAKSVDDPAPWLDLVFPKMSDPTDQCAKKLVVNYKWVLYQSDVPHICP